ncbi:MAG: Eco57I restriction-modification methylase domain-containing protein [Deltaproteobacteria bacterium]
MPVLERKQTVLKRLEQLRGLDTLKELFWTELNYERENKPLSMRGWPDSARKALVDDPILFASGGEDNAFHVLYCRLVSDSLQRNLERPIVNQLIREHPYCLFVFSDTTQSSWHFLNIKYDERAEQRRLFRRITVRADGGLRTAAERLQMLDLVSIGKELFSIPALEIQKRHDDAFDVEKVTKAFYKELANWYFWALKHVRFPKDAPKEADGHDHISVIRMITRLIFCWFVKEKGLIPEELFDQRRLDELLDGFAPDNNAGKDSVFYKAILQNLFFATLNTEMDKRCWAKDEQNFMAHSLYRHHDLFQEPDAVLALFKNTPFLNGGLFECLDKDLGEGARPRYVRIDGFSRRPDSQPVVPDFLFFGSEREEDLSADYGDKKFRKVRVRGLIHTLQRYRFTIEENTPIEQEVALDPELSGKVFENLLAAYNPETGATARKQTGSFYTPREIVDYMVDEALITFLKGSFSTENAEATEKNLRRLASWEESDHDFDDRETEMLIAAIDKLKALDPAVGSGAFPMGILHKLVFILGKLDPRNEQWEQRQIRRVRDAVAAAEKIEDAAIRERTVRELEQQIVGIEEAFERNELDYGRKLYLIENCLYGVDIQSIAVQIAKMRFFISLIVDQRIDPDAPNLGVRPLPNLETKFVAANTLIGIDRPGQQILRYDDIAAKETELRKVREKHFNAKTLASKAMYRERDKKLRAEIAALLKKDGWGGEVAKMLAAWDPYDQNASAPFFDPEWMFGVRDGFDITIGNPPYVRADEQSDWNRRQREQILAGKNYETLWEKWDLFVPFIEKGYKLLKPGGVTTLIVSDAFCHSKYAQKPQNWFLQHARILRLDFCSNVQIFDAAVHNLIYFFQKADGASNVPERRLHQTEFGNVTVLPSDEQTNLTYRAFFPERSEQTSFAVDVIQMGQICYISYGLRPSSDEHEAKGEFVTADLVSSTRDKIHCKPYVEGKHLSNWLPATNIWLEWGTARAPGKFCRPTFTEMYEVPEKIIAQRSPGPDPVACYDNVNLIFTPASVGFIPWHALHGVQNNSLKKSARYRGERPPRPDLPTREELEATSHRFAVKYLLGVMNSTVARDFLRANRRSNIHLYPDDWKKLPIPDVDSTAQAPLIKLVDRILDVKKADPSAVTAALEGEIDRIVYELYGLTEEEIAIVKGRE